MPKGTPRHDPPLALPDRFGGKGLSEGATTQLCQGLRRDNKCPGQHQTSAAPFSPTSYRSRRRFFPALKSSYARRSAVRILDSGVERRRVFDEEAAALHDWLAHAFPQRCISGAQVCSGSTEPFYWPQRALLMRLEFIKEARTDHSARERSA